MTYVKTQKYDECNSLRDETYNAIIGNDVWIGNDVIIMGGLKIGDGAIIGTGAIITKNVPPYAVVIGVPGKVIKYRFTDDEIGKLLEIQWWNKDKEWISENSDYFDNINRFLSLFPD
jgi:acetyltransferase-like isoleucine patch superfamily enzyme